MKSLESLILKVEDYKVIDILKNNVTFDYLICPDNRLILGKDWENINKYEKEDIVYVFVVDYTTSLLNEEIIEINGIENVINEYLLNNWNLYKILETFIKEPQVHLIIEIEYYNHQGYYDQYPDVDVLFDIFGRLDDDYLIDDLEQYRIKN